LVKDPAPHVRLARRTLLGSLDVLPSAAIFAKGPVSARELPLWAALTHSQPLLFGDPASRASSAFGGEGGMRSIGELSHRAEDAVAGLGEK